MLTVLAAPYAYNRARLLHFTLLLTWLDYRKQVPQ